MSGSGIAADVLAGIKEGLAATGPASPSVIVRKGAATGPAHNPAPGVEQEYECTAISFTFRANERSDSRVIDCDMRFMVASSDLTIEPSPGDKIQSAGEAYMIEMVKALRPAGVVIYWEIYARSLGAATAY